MQAKYKKYDMTDEAKGKNFEYIEILDYRSG